MFLCKLVFTWNCNVMIDVINCNLGQLIQRIVLLCVFRMIPYLQQRWLDQNDNSKTNFGLWCKSALHFTVFSSKVLPTKRVFSFPCSLTATFRDLLPLYFSSLNFSLYWKPLDIKLHSTVWKSMILYLKNDLALFSHIIFTLPSDYYYFKHAILHVEFLYFICCCMHVFLVLWIIAICNFNCV
jgi:hypothetical protein